MSEQSDKSHFSERTLDIAETGQRLLGRLGRPVVRALTGSSFPAYTQLKWSKQEHLDPDDYKWCHVDGDPGAGLLPRFWSKAAIIGASSAEFMEFYNEHKKENIDQAAVFVSDGVMRVGTEPRLAMSMFGRRVEGQNANNVLAMRIGKGTLQASIGLWLRDEQELFVPDSLTLIEEHVPINELEPLDPWGWKSGGVALV